MQGGHPAGLLVERLLGDARVGVLTLGRRIEPAPAHERPPTRPPSDRRPPPHCGSSDVGGDRRRVAAQQAGPGQFEQGRRGRAVGAVGPADFAAGLVAVANGILMGDRRSRPTAPGGWPIRPSVRVPVLSDASTVTEPSVSTAGRRRGPARAVRHPVRPSASAMVTTAGATRAPQRREAHRQHAISTGVGRRSAPGRTPRSMTGTMHTENPRRRSSRRCSGVSRTGRGARSRRGCCRAHSRRRSASPPRAAVPGDTTVPASSSSRRRGRPAATRRSMADSSTLKVACSASPQVGRHDGRPPRRARQSPRAPRRPRAPRGGAVAHHLGRRCGQTG